MTTSQRRNECELDPYHVTWDWDRRNNMPERHADHASASRGSRSTGRTSTRRIGRTRRCRAGAAGVVQQSAGHRARPSRARRTICRSVDIYDGGFAFASRQSARSAHGEDAERARRGRTCGRAPRIRICPGFDRPLMGYGGDVNYLDGLFKADAYKDWDLSPFVLTPGPQIKAQRLRDRGRAERLASAAGAVVTRRTSSRPAERRRTDSAVTADSDYVTMRGLARRRASPRACSRRGRSTTRGYVRADASIGW